MKVQCKYMVINKKYCGTFKPCWHTKTLIKNEKGRYSGLADCRNVIEIDWVQYILYKDQVVVVEE